MFTELILVLKQQRIGSKVTFVTLLNSSVTMSPWIVEKTFPVKLTPNPFSLSSLNCSLSFFLKYDIIAETDFMYVKTNVA